MDDNGGVSLNKQTQQKRKHLSEMVTTASILPFDFVRKKISVTLTFPAWVRLHT